MFYELIEYSSIGGIKLESLHWLSGESKQTLQSRGLGFESHLCQLWKLFSYMVVTNGDKFVTGIQVSRWFTDNYLWITLGPGSSETLF